MEEPRYGENYVSNYATGVTNFFWHTGLCNVLIDTTQKQADSGSSVVNDIDEDYINIDDDLTTSEIVMDEDIVKDIIYI